MRVQLRPTIASDLQHLIGEPLPHRIRALTAHIGDQVLGVGGLGYLPNGVVAAFVVMTDAARDYPVAIHRAGLAAMRMIRESGEPRVVAMAQADNDAAEPWLLRLGFRRLIVDDVAAFVWERDATDVE